MTFEQFIPTTTSPAAHPKGIAPYDYQSRTADDSDGRTLRLILRELLRRLDFPRVIPDPDTEAVRGGLTS